MIVFESGIGIGGRGGGALAARLRVRGSGWVSAQWAGYGAGLSSQQLWGRLSSRERRAAPSCQGANLYATEESVWTSYGPCCGADLTVPLGPAQDAKGQWWRAGGG